VIQLKDGEPSILAGLVQKQDTSNVSGTPGLGELPFFKYFFSSRDKTVQQNEIVFLLIPHIVRESILTDENTRAVYTGTNQSLELIRRDPPPMLAASGRALAATPAQTTSAANAATAMLGQMAADARPLTPNAVAGLNQPPMVVAPPAPVAGGLPVTFSVSPAVLNQAAGSTFQVAVMASNAKDLFSVPMQMQFDPKVLQLVNVDAGEMLGRDGQAVALVHRDEGNGAVTISASRPPNTAGVTGQGTICTLTFKAVTPGDVTLSLVRIGAKDSHQVSLPTVGGMATVHVK
jgi:general secretion pathway protein D